MRRLCPLTVSSAMNRRSPISRLERPGARARGEPLDDPLDAHSWFRGPCEDLAGLGIGTVHRRQRAYPPIPGSLCVVAGACAWIFAVESLQATVVANGDSPCHTYVSACMFRAGDSTIEEYNRFLQRRAALAIVAILLMRARRGRSWTEYAGGRASLQPPSRRSNSE